MTLSWQCCNYLFLSPKTAHSQRVAFFCSVSSSRTAYLAAEAATDMQLSLGVAKATRGTGCCFGPPMFFHFSSSTTESQHWNVIFEQQRCCCSTFQVGCRAIGYDCGCNAMSSRPILSQWTRSPGFKHTMHVHLNHLIYIYICIHIHMKKRERERDLYIDPDFQ